MFEIYLYVFFSLIRIISISLYEAQLASRRLNQRQSKLNFGSFGTLPGLSPLSTTYN